MGLAHVEGHAAGPQVRAGDAEVDRLLAGQDPQALGPGAEDLVLGQDLLVHLDRVQDARPPRPEARQELVVDVEVHPADPEEVEQHPLAGDGRQEVHHLVAVDEPVQDGGQAAEVEGEEAHHQAVAEHPVQLDHQGPDVLRPSRGLDPVQLLERESRRVLVVHRRHVVHGVDVGQDRGVGRVLAQLLDPAMEVAEHRVEVDDHLATDLEDQPHDPVGGGMLGAHVHEHLPVAEGVDLALPLGLRRAVRGRDDVEAIELRPGSHRSRLRPGERWHVVELERIADARLVRWRGLAAGGCPLRGRLGRGFRGRGTLACRGHTGSPGSSRWAAASSRRVRSHVSGRSSGMFPAAGESAASSGSRKSFRWGKDR